MNSPAFWIGYVILIFAFMYFIAIRPQQKEKKKMQELMASIAVGDSVLTSSGFYGVIIDMTDDTVIVEFGSNKNCRIPMQKQAIVQVEKPEAYGRKGAGHREGGPALFSLVRTPSQGPCLHGIKSMLAKTIAS